MSPYRQSSSPPSTPPLEMDLPAPREGPPPTPRLLPTPDRYLAPLPPLSLGLPAMRLPAQLPRNRCRLPYRRLVPQTTDSAATENPVPSTSNVPEESIRIAPLDLAGQEQQQRSLLSFTDGFGAIITAADRTTHLPNLQQRSLPSFTDGFGAIIAASDNAANLADSAGPTAPALATGVHPPHAPLHGLRDLARSCGHTRGDEHRVSQPTPEQAPQRPREAPRTWRDPAPIIPDSDTEDGDASDGSDSSHTLDHGEPEG